MNKIFSSDKDRNLTILVLSIILIIFLVLGLFSFSFLDFFKNSENVRSFVSGYGVYGPLALITIHLLQILIFPIPGQVIGFASGYLFGWFWGTIYTMIGVTIGSFLAVFLARKFGRPFVEKVITKKTLKRFDYVMDDRGIFTLFMLFLLPAMPDDSICFLAGLTKLKIRTIVFLAVIGRFPGFLVLNLVGDGIALAEFSMAIGIVIAMVVISALVYIYRIQFETFFNKIVIKLRKNGF